MRLGACAVREEGVRAAQKTGGGFGRACVLCSLVRSTLLTLLQPYLPGEDFSWDRLAPLKWDLDAEPPKRDRFPLSYLPSYPRTLSLKI